MVGASAHVNVVCCPITIDGTLLCSNNREVRPEVFNDVVLDKRVLRPTIDSKVAVPARAVGTIVVNDPRM